MTDKKKPTRDYEVGYARTPTEHRFKKGQSGNPSGRRGRSAARHPIDILSEPVAVSHDGKTQKMSPFEAALRKAFEKIVTKGDLRSIKFLLQLFEKYHVLQARPGPESGGVWVAPRWAKLEEVALLMKTGVGAPRIRQDPDDPEKTYVSYE